jgi:hypothetical protein
LVLSRQFTAFVKWVIAHKTPLLVFDLIGLHVFLPLLWYTRVFTEGTTTWQWVAFGEVALGAVYACILSWGIGILLLNFVFWVGLVIGGICVIGVLLASL